MKRFWKSVVAAAVVVCGAAVAQEAARPPAPAAAPAPLELSDLPAVIATLRARYLDPSALSDRELNEAAAHGILDHLGNGAKIVDPKATNKVAVADVAKTELLADSIHYVRLGKLGRDTAKSLDKAMANIPCDKTNGVILDLRFVRGDDFNDAAEVAGRFLPKGTPLFVLKSGQGGESRRFATSHEKGCTVTPLMVLVNSETAGSAEALVAGLRDQQRVVVLGSATAGEAVERTAVPLAGGRHLLLAVAQVVLPDGTRIFPSGVVPDVPVKTGLELERKLLLGPEAQKNLRASLEPRITKRRLNEAELVRALESNDDKPAAPPEKPAGPEGDRETRNENTKVEQPADVTLTRALDILKGIRVLRRD